MRKELFMHNILYCILAATLFLCGCGNSSSTVGSHKKEEIKQEEISYVAQPVSLPEYDSFDGAYSDGDNLFYATAMLDENSKKYQTTFYTLKKDTAEPEVSFHLEENQMVQNMTIDADGNIYYLGYEVVLHEDEQKALDTMLYKLNPDGGVLLALNVNEYSKKQERTVIQGLAVDGENRIVMFTSNQILYVLDQNGELLFEVRADGRIYDICSSGEKVFVAYGGIDGIEVREIDVNGKKLSNKLTHNITGNQFHMVGDRNGNLLIATDKSVYKYDFESEETVKKFNWETYSFIGISAGILLPYGEDGVLAISRDYTTFPMKTEVVAFREAIEGESHIQDKIVITLGTVETLTRVIQEGIVTFNKTNSDYRIEVKNYEEDYTLLNTEIIAGKAPDVLVLPFSRIDQFAKSGALEDLNSYLDGDGAIDRSDFLENILKAVETNGHLYGIPSSFNIDTLVGKTSILGDKPGWSLEELLTFAEEFPEGTDIFVDTSKSGVLRLLMHGYAEQLVVTDQVDNPVKIDLLIKMLEFANQYENDDQYIYDSNLDVKAMEGQLILLDDWVGDGVAYRAHSDSVFGEPVTYIGYPTAEGNGNLIRCFNTLAINSGSEHKDIAWDFITILLSEESQISIVKDISTWAFPVRKDALEECFVLTQKWEWNDLLRKYYFIRDREETVTDEEIEPIRNLIQNVDTAWRESPDIDKIIYEEAALYFSGVKPVEEVVDVIENKIKIYVNENQ